MSRVQPYYTLPLTLLLLLSSLGSSLIQASFSLNRNYIIKELCENRKKPEMKCDGKCYLRKQIERQEKRNAPAKEQRISTESFNWLFTGNIRIENILPTHTHEIILYSDYLSSGFYRALIHPPPSAA